MSINVASKLTGVYSLGIYHDIFKDSMDWNKKLSDYILKEQWNELSNHSSKMRGLNGIIIEQIHGESIQLKDVRKILKETNFEDIFSKLKIQLQDSTFREEVNKILLEQNKSPELIDKFLQINFTNSNFNMDLDDTTSTVMEIVIGAGGSAFVAGFHSIYNQYYSEFQTVCTSIISEELEEIKKIIKLEYEMIMSDFYKIYASLVQGSAHVMIDTCQKILHSQESRLVWLASICGTLSLCTMNYLKDKDNKSAKMFGPVDLLAGQTTRTWFLLCLVCLYVTRLSLLPEDDPQLKKEIQTARKLSFRSMVPDGKNVSMRDLSLKGLEFNEKFVEVGGFVKDITKERTSDGKFINKFTLYEPGRDEQITVFLIFEELRNHGFCNSCYVRVNGNWKQSSNIMDSPALQVDRISLSTLSKQSWFDNMIVEVRPWFDFYPNSHNVSWSIRPEQKNTDDGTLFLEGATEPIFMPIVISKKEGN